MLTTGTGFGTIEADGWRRQGAPNAPFGLQGFTLVLVCALVAFTYRRSL